MVEEHQSRASAGGGSTAGIDEQQQEEMQQAKETLAAFLKRLTDGDLLCLATRNGLFDAEGRPATSHFIIDVKSSFIHQTIAVENAYWSSHFRPKLECDFLTKMITPDTETNVLGLPSEMIVPESIQRRGSKKNPTRDEPIVKVQLQPGTYVVGQDGVSIVIDRASIPGLDVKGDADHLLISLPSARIDSLFFTPSPPPPSNGHAHPSEDTTTEEDERPPALQMSSGQHVNKKGEAVEVKEEDTADETFDSPEHKEEEINGGPMAVAKTEMPSLDLEAEAKAHALATIANEFAPMTNGVNGQKEEEEVEVNAQPASRKARASSSSKREWKDWVEEPRESKRVSIPTRKRQLTEELDTASKNGQTKRSKERSGSNSSSCTPPPTLEREEPMAEPIIVKIKRAKSGSNKSILASLKEVKQEHGYATSPVHYPATPHLPIISVKPHPRSTPNHVMRFTKVKRTLEDGQCTPSTSSMTYSSVLHNGTSSVIGVKPPPKELTARKTPKKEKDPDVKEESTTKRDALLMKTRIQAPRAAVIKGQKAARKRMRLLDDSEDGGDEESGDDGDERARSSDEEGQAEEPEPYDESTMAATIHSEPEEPDLAKSPEARGEFKIYTIIKDESDEEKRKADEQILVRIRKEEAEAREAKKRLEEKLARRDELRTERAEAAAQAEASGESSTTTVDSKDDGPRSAPSFSQRDDPFFVAMMQGGQKKQGPFLKRSLASIYNQSRDFYHSLTKKEPCLEWHPRPRVGPDVDGYVHQVSGYPVKVANGAEMAAFQLFDLHNHREFRLGEIVWAKFQREYWPGYIKAFIPAEAFNEYRGDAVMIQWISEEPQYNYVCYADVFHFDLYFSIMYLPAKTDKAYTINMAKALAMDGRPGFWEEYITKPIFDEMDRIGGNISTIPMEHMKRIQENAKMRNPTATQVSATLAIIQQKEINHFQYHYKAFYKGRNTNRFVPKKDNCTAMLCLESSTAPEEDEIRIVPRKTSIYKVYKDENKKWHYNVKPEYSTIPTFAEEQVEVHVTDRKTKAYDIYHLYNGASAAPIVETLYEQKPVPLGVHGGIVFDAAAKARLAAYLKERKREEAEMSGEPLPEDSEVPSAAQADSAELAAALCNLSAVTAHEVLHLMDVQQQVIDPASKENNEAWIANTAKCAEHVRLEFEVREKKIRDYNEKFEEKKRQDEERKAEAQREKEEKAAARSMRLGGVIDTIGIVKLKKPRRSKGSESSPGTSAEKVKKPRLSESSDKPAPSPRGPKKKVVPPVA